MKILVVSGFLGAGKTTFIREFIRRVRRDCAIVENEYGEIGVDGQVLSEREGLSVRELSEGCICCSAKTDFAASVLTIANTIDPEVLIVEPSGVGMLGNILQNLQKIEYERICVLQPVALIDARAFEDGMREYPEISRDQIASAHTILLTKTEGASQEEIEAVCRAAATINPAAAIVRTPYREQPDTWFSDLLDRPLTQRVTAEGTGEAPETCGFTDISLPDANALLLFLSGVVSGVFGGVYRAKGYLCTGGAWLHFDVVDKRYSVTGCEPMPDSRAMFIGKNLKRNLLRQALLKEFRVNASLLLNQKKKRPVT